jgi:dihydrofolate reductase
MSRTKVTLVVARADNGVIGKNGELPWRLRSDMHHFRSVTIDKPMIMGRKTFESLPKLLDRRRHIVLTRDESWHAEGAEVVHSVDEAMRAVANEPEVSVIGGAEIYRLFLDRADKIWLTQVHDSPEGDTVLPDFDYHVWHRTGLLKGHPTAQEPAHDFVILERRRTD